MSNAVLLRGNVLGGLAVKDLNFFIEYNELVWREYADIQRSPKLKACIDSGQIKVEATRNQNVVSNLGRKRRTNAQAVPAGEVSAGELSTLQALKTEFRKMGETLETISGALLKTSESQEKILDMMGSGAYIKAVSPESAMETKSSKKEPMFIPSFDLGEFKGMDFEVEEVSSEAGLGEASKKLKKMKDK